MIKIVCDGTGNHIQHCVIQPLLWNGKTIIKCEFCRITYRQRTAHWRAMERDLVRAGLTELPNPRASEETTMTTAEPRQDQVQEIAGEHGGRFYFVRAFWTTMGILLSWTVWVILPAILLVAIISIFGGIGALIPDGQPTSEPTVSASCHPDFESC